MGSNRRNFLKWSALSGLGLIAGCVKAEKQPSFISTETPVPLSPVILSTWNFGRRANEEALRVLKEKGSALDAVEAGVRLIESDPNNTTVGLGGTPDREGKVTLDACIMDHEGRCGSVAFLEDIEHPVSVARRIMEETPHVMLVGEGARQFAIEQGFPVKNLLTEKSKAAWKNWLERSEYRPIINIENHDTIGQLVLDEKKNLAGACTTSGLGYKIRGRVGDSPIIGSGLFVDNEVGAACATGLGEAIMRVAGTATVVELMRQGYPPEEACREVVARIHRKHKNNQDFQVGLLAISKTGETGAFSMHKGFSYALHREGTSATHTAPALLT